MKNTKEQLIDYLQTYGKTDSWKNIYNQFPYRGQYISDKKKSDLVRSLHRRHVKSKPSRYDLTNQEKIRTNLKDAKILIFDVERSPHKSFVWSLWQQNINPTSGQLVSESFMLTWSAKWLFDNEVISDKLTSQEALNEDDGRIVKSLWELFDEANIVIAHNAYQFDIKVLNTRFLQNNLPPPSPYQVIDTLVHARKHFKFASNKLDYLGKVLGLSRKLSTNFELWVKCLDGNEDALLEMEIYNIEDVKLLEAVYLKLRPFISPHPNINLIIENTECACPTCSSTNLSWGAKYHTYANTYNAFYCVDCNAVGRQRVNATKQEVKDVLTISTPRA